MHRNSDWTNTVINMTYYLRYIVCSLLYSTVLFINIYYKTILHYTPVYSILSLHYIFHLPVDEITQQLSSSTGKKAIPKYFFYCQGVIIRKLTFLKLQISKCPLRNQIDNLFGFSDHVHLTVRPQSSVFLSNALNQFFRGIHCTAYVKALITVLYKE